MFFLLVVLKICHFVFSLSHDFLFSSKHKPVNRCFYVLEKETRSCDRVLKLSGPFFSFCALQFCEWLMETKMKSLKNQKGVHLVVLSIT